MSYQETSRSLLDRARGRDASAWDRLVALYGPLVDFWCRRWGAEPEDAREVAQEVFLAVAEGLKQFDHRGQGSFRAWVRGIARFKFLDQRRRLQQTPEAAGGTEAHLRLQAIPDVTPEDEEAERSNLYHRALSLIRSEFEERSWLAFWYTAVEGRETSAVGAELQMSTTAVRVAKSRVLARLRQEAGVLIE